MHIKYRVRKATGTYLCRVFRYDGLTGVHYTAMYRKRGITNDRGHMATRSLKDALKWLDDQTGVTV